MAQIMHMRNILQPDLATSSLWISAEEVLLSCFDFLDPEGLCHARAVVTKWSSAASCDLLWLPHARKMWPGLHALQEAGLVKDSMISVYQRRRQQENGYEKDLSEQALADSLKKYNLLAEVWEDERSIMNGVMKFDVDEDFLAAKVPPGRIHGTVRNAENLSISLTVVRLSDCKYMKLCTNSKVRNIENDFVSFSAVLPATIDRVCNLGRPTWAGSRSEDSLPSCCLFVDNISWTPADREEGPRGIQSFGLIKAGMINYGTDLNAQELLSLIESFGTWL